MYLVLTLSVYMCCAKAYNHIHTAPFQYAMIELPFQRPYPRVLCVTEDTLGTALLVLVQLYTTFTHLAVAAPSHLSILPNCIEDMGQVQLALCLLLLLLAGKIFLQFGWNGSRKIWDIKDN